MPSPHCLVSKIDPNVHPPLFWEEISPIHEIDIIVISNQSINWFQKTLAPKIITKDTPQIYEVDHSVP